MRAPTVSVVVPFHNQIEWLAEAVKSEFDLSGHPARPPGWPL